MQLPGDRLFLPSQNLDQNFKYWREGAWRRAGSGNVSRWPGKGGASEVAGAVRRDAGGPDNFPQRQKTPSFGTYFSQILFFIIGKRYLTVVIVYMGQSVHLHLRLLARV